DRYDSLVPDRPSQSPRVSLSTSRAMAVRGGSPPKSWPIARSLRACSHDGCDGALGSAPPRVERLRPVEWRGRWRNRRGADPSASKGKLAPILCPAGGRWPTRCWIGGRNMPMRLAVAPRSLDAKEEGPRPSSTRNHHLTDPTRRFAPIERPSAPESAP